MLNIKVIVFDVDGVLLESTDIKTDAFKELFKNYPKHIDKIITYHIKNGGISRFIKFEHIYNKILNKPFNEEIKKQLGNKFKKIVLKKVLECPFVDGTLEFLQKYHNKKHLYVVSGTPDEELFEILEKRKINQYFTNIYGSSKQKSEWLNHIIKKELLKPEEIVFIGDTLSDYKSSKKTHIIFIGRVSSDKENIFHDKNIRIIKDNNQLSKLLEKTYN